LNLLLIYSTSAQKHDKIILFFSLASQSNAQVIHQILPFIAGYWYFLGHLLGQVQIARKCQLQKRRRSRRRWHNPLSHTQALTYTTIHTATHTHTHTQEHTHTEARTLRERDLASLLRHIGKCKQANKVKAGFFALKKQKKKNTSICGIYKFQKIRLDWTEVIAKYMHVLFKDLRIKMDFYVN